MTSLTLIAAAIASIFAAPAVGAAPAPRMPIASFEQLAKPLPLPYDGRADANSVVSAALARAQQAHKLLLIDLGGNWCLDCRLLAGTMAVPALKRWLDTHYEVVTVDIGRLDKNLDIPVRFGAPGKPKGVPALLVYDPQARRLLNGGRTTALADARSMNPQGLADWLAQWVR